MNTKSENYGRLTRWIVGGGLLAYALRTAGWRRWVALTAASKVLGTVLSDSSLLKKVIDLQRGKVAGQPA